MRIDAPRSATPYLHDIVVVIIIITIINLFFFHRHHVKRVIRIDALPGLPGSQLRRIDYTDSRVFSIARRRAPPLCRAQRAMRRMRPG